MHVSAVCCEVLLTTANLGRKIAGTTAMKLKVDKRSSDDPVDFSCKQTSGLLTPFLFCSRVNFLLLSRLLNPEACKLGSELLLDVC